MAPGAARDEGQRIVLRRSHPGRSTFMRPSAANGGQSTRRSGCRWRRTRGP